MAIKHLNVFLIKNQYLNFNAHFVAPPRMKNPKHHLLLQFHTSYHNNLFNYLQINIAKKKHRVLKLGQ